MYQEGQQVLSAKSDPPYQSETIADHSPYLMDNKPANSKRSVNVTKAF